MISRRSVIAGMASCAAPLLGGSLLSGCAQPLATRRPPPLVHQTAPLPPTTLIDAVVDINHSSTVTDFALMRSKSSILGVLHKVSEGGTWVDPLYKVRRAQAENAGLLWGGYHFGTRQYSGGQQANVFLSAAQPTATTLMALDLEPNERSPDNTMTIAQAEEFVSVIYQATRLLPLIYTHPKWANGEPYGRSGITLGDAISPQSILASCDLWLADYRPTPEVPRAWAHRGWRLWQYAGDNSKGGGGALGYMSQMVSGVTRCDRNYFSGDVAALYQFWQGTSKRV